MDLQKLHAPLTGVSTEDWAVACAASVACFLAIHGGVMLLRRALCRMAEQGRAEKPFAELLKGTLARTSNLAVLVISLLIGISLLDLAPPWDQRVQHLSFIVLGLQLMLYLDRAVSIGTRRYFQQHAEDEAAPSTVANTLVGWAVKAMLWIVFFLAVLSNLGINVTTFVASLGIGGIAIALAVQNILGDLFASLAIAVDKPFEVGDAISVLNTTGTVEHVGLKTTRIRADSGEQIVISNADLLKNVVRNFKRMSTRRVQFPLRVNPATPPAMAGGIPAALREIIERQENVRYERVHLKSVSQDALEFEVVFYVLDSSYANYMDAQQAILLAAMEKFEQLGVTINNPAQHLVLERQPQADAPPRNAPTALKVQPRVQPG
jgi:small-conductance mechanosensitive channel